MAWRKHKRTNFGGISIYSHRVGQSNDWEAWASVDGKTYKGQGSSRRRAVNTVKYLIRGYG